MGTDKAQAEMLKRAEQKLQSSIYGTGGISPEEFKIYASHKVLIYIIYLKKRLT